MSCWAVVKDDAGRPHVLPVWPDGTMARWHRPLLACPACRPLALRRGPLDDPVISHVEPFWPGAGRGWMQ